MRNTNIFNRDDFSSKNYWYVGLVIINHSTWRGAMSVFCYSQICSFDDGIKAPKNTKVIGLSPPPVSHLESHQFLLIRWAVHRSAINAVGFSIVRLLDLLPLCVALKLISYIDWPYLGEDGMLHSERSDVWVSTLFVHLPYIWKKVHMIDLG